MKIDSSRYHVLMGNAATGDGEPVQARGPEAGRCAGHFGIVADANAVILVEGYFHDLQPERRERYSIRITTGSGTYAIGEVDVSKQPASRDGRPDQINIPPLALHASSLFLSQPDDPHWEQPDMQQPIDLRWEIFEVDDQPKLRLFLTCKVIPV